MKLVHCSYHKCLTTYYRKVLSNLYNRTSKFGNEYLHFKSNLEDFYQESNNYRISSINNHMLDFERLGNDFRISRFIRDPRDLVVSGYFYHKQGTEVWSRIINPVKEDWEVVNGCIPRNMGKGHSFSSYLKSLSEEEGLIAEIDFRYNHFDSMKKWPFNDPRIKLFRYENIIGREKDVFAEMFSFYELSETEISDAITIADRLSAKQQIKKIKHIRNPNAGQWKDHFTPKVIDYFEQQHGELIDLYGYRNE